MLRLRRKQQKATARLNNFISKQQQEDKEDGWDSYRSKQDTTQVKVMPDFPSDFLKNEQQETNKEENKQQNTSEISPKDVLVDSLSYTNQYRKP